MSISQFPTVVASSGSNQNGFALNTPAVLDNGSATFLFAENQPAGRYTVAATNGNYNYDMYLVSQNNQPVGYSNTSSIVATGSFNRLVIYNASANVTYTFTYKLLGLESANGQIESGAAPFVISATPVSLPNRDDTTTVLGGNFSPNAQAFFRSNSNVEAEAKQVVRVSSTELIVTRPDDMPSSESPWTLVVTNPEAATPIRGRNVLINYFDAGQVIQWVTASLPGYLLNTAYTTTLQATDPEGSTPSYEVIAGSLPAGLSLDQATGTISGTTSSTSLSVFTVRAFDEGGNFADRIFSLSRPVSLTIRQTSGTVNIPTNDTPFLISGGGGAGGNGRFTTGSWPGGGSGYITAGTINAGNYSLTVGAGGIGAGYDSAVNNGGTTTFGSYTAAGGVHGRSNGAGGSAGGPGVGIVTDQAGADGATGFIDGEGPAGSGVRVSQAAPSFVQFTNSGQTLEMQGGRLIFDNVESRPGASGGKFYSGGGGTKSTNNFSVAAAANTAGGNGIYGGGGGAGGGGASNNYTGPGDGISGNGGAGLLATLTYV